MKHSQELLRSPYAIGGALGLLNTFAFATAKRGLGVTSAFENGAAIVGRKVAPDAMHINEYMKAKDERPSLDWEAFLAAGIVVGSYLVAKQSNEHRASFVPKGWSRRFGPSVSKRLAAAFVGGAAMMFGARMAKGCTSGHCITGTSQLALSSWVFSPLMFASAALAARAIYGKERTR